MKKLNGWISKTYLFNKAKLKIQMKQLISVTCPKIHLWIPLESPNIVVVVVWNPMAHSISFTLGSSILDELESKSSMGLHPKMHESVKNSTRLIGLLVEVQPYWPPFPFFCWTLRKHEKMTKKRMSMKC